MYTRKCILVMYTRIHIAHTHAHSCKHAHRIIKNVKVNHKNIVQNNDTIKLLNIIIKLL